MMMKFLMFNVAVTAAIVYVIAFEDGIESPLVGASDSKQPLPTIGEMLGVNHEPSGVEGIDPEAEAARIMAEMEARLRAEIAGETSIKADPTVAADSSEPGEHTEAPALVAAGVARPVHVDMPVMKPADLAEPAVADAPLVDKNVQGDPAPVVDETAIAAAEPAIREIPAAEEPSPAEEPAIAQQDSPAEETPAEETPAQTEPGADAPAETVKPESGSESETDAQVMLASADDAIAQRYAGMMLPTSDQRVIDNRNQVLGIAGAPAETTVVAALDPANEAADTPSIEATIEQTRKAASDSRKSSATASGLSAGAQAVLDSLSAGDGRRDARRDDLMNIAESMELIAIGMGIE